MIKLRVAKYRRKLEMREMELWKTLNHLELISNYGKPHLKNGTY